MSYAVNTPKGQVRLMDLPLEVFHTLEEQTGRSWVDLLVSPAATSKSAVAVYRVACEHVGAEPEVLTPARVVDAASPVFVLVDDDDDPDEIVFEDGIPKSGAGPETPGLSGAPDGSDGLPTSSGDSR